MSAVESGVFEALGMLRPRHRSAIRGLDDETREAIRALLDCHDAVVRSSARREAYENGFTDGHAIRNGALRRREARKLTEATAWLRDALADGHVPAAQILLMAAGAGHSERTLRDAKRDLGVVSLPMPGNGQRKVWALAEHTAEVAG